MSDTFSRVQLRLAPPDAPRTLRRAADALTAAAARPDREVGPGQAAVPADRRDSTNCRGTAGNNSGAWS